MVTESSVNMRAASGCEEGVAEAERGAVPFPCCVLLPPYAESSSAAHAAATCCLASADPLGYRRNAYSTTHAPTSAIILRGSGSSGSREHTALSDQGDPSTCTQHGAYYLKDRGAGPKVWYPAVDGSRLRHATSPSSAHLIGLQCKSSGFQPSPLSSWL